MDERELYNDYSKKYNELSEKMEQAGIDIKLLNKLLEAAQKLRMIGKSS